MTTDLSTSVIHQLLKNILIYNINIEAEFFKNLWLRASKKIQTSGVYSITGSIGGTGSNRNDWSGLRLAIGCSHKIACLAICGGIFVLFDGLGTLRFILRTFSEAFWSKLWALLSFQRSTSRLHRRSYKIFFPGSSWTLKNGDVWISGQGSAENCHF